MAAVVGGPGLSALLSWPTDHLTEAASHWDAVGEQSFGVAHGVWSDAMVADWEGHAAEALRTDTHADMTTTSAVVDQIQDAASVARGGASELEAARSHLRYAVEDARAAGFTVGEDLSVRDRMTGGSAAERAARAVIAQSHAGEIGGRAAQLVSTDAQVASRVTAAVAGVGSTFPRTPKSNGQIHAVDNHTFKQAPDKPPPPPPPKGPKADDIRKVLEKLPGRKGREYIKTVRTPEDLERLRQWVAEHGSDMPSRYDADKGRWQRLPDGSEIGERCAAGSNGKPVLDINLRRPDGTTDYFKIHINPETGGALELPPAEPAPAEVAPAEAAPAEPAPAKSGPIEGFEGGGPVGIPVGPHFVHTPGSIDHGIPIIGEDDPGESARDFKH